MSETVSNRVPAVSQMDEDTAAAYLLNVTPADVLAVSRLTNGKDFEQFWEDAKQYLLEKTAFSDDDTGAEKYIKQQNRDRGFELLKNYTALALGTAETNGNSKYFKDKALKLKSDIQELQENILTNPVARIGRHKFGPGNLGATDVAVSEAYGTSTSSVLRSEADVTYRQPQSMTKISMSLVFAGADEINNRLRPLIADLKVSPITTVESPLVIDCLVNQFSTPSIEEEIQQRILDANNSDITKQLDSLTTEAASSWENLRDLLKNDDLVIEYMAARIRNKKKELGAKLTPTQLNTPDNILLLGIMVPVVVTDLVVTTDPRAIDTIHLTIDMLRYNSEAFGITGLQFKDINGDPTPDIEQCPWIKKYSDFVYLQSSNLETYLSTYRNIGGSDLLFEWKGIYDAVDAAPKIFPNPANDTGKLVVEQVKASFGFSVAPLPLLGNKYPTVQIMGSSSVQAQLTLATDSKAVVRDFHRMKDELDSTARAVGGLNRNERVKITNSVLNLLGARNFIITAVQTGPYPDTTNAYSINVTLVQAEYSTDRQQRLTLSPQGVTEDMVKELWDYLWNKWDAEIRARSNPPANPNQFGKLAMFLIFGDGSGEPGKGGIMSGDNLLAGISQLAINSSFSAEPNPDQVIRNLYKKLRVANNRELFNQYFGYEGKNGSDAVQEGTEDRFAGSIASDVSFDSFVDFASFLTNAVLNQIKSGPDGNTSTIVKYMLNAGNNSTNITKFGPTKALWDAMFQVIMAPPIQVPKDIDGNSLYNIDTLVSTRESLFSLFTTGDIVAFGADFPLLKRILESKPKASRVTGSVTSSDSGFSQIEAVPLSNYPDMHLPTYEQIFSTPDGKSMMAPDGSPLWIRFAPTYSDLGIVPVFDDIDMANPGQASGQTARTIDSQVEPLFWIYSKRVKDRLRAGLQETLARVSPDTRVDKEKMVGEREKNILQVNVNTEEIRRDLGADAATISKVIQDTLHDHITRKANNRGEQGSLSAQQIKSGKFNKTYEVIDNQGQLIALIEPAYENRGPRYKIRVIQAGRPVYANATLGIAYDRARGDRSKALLEDIVNKTKDNAFSSIRHFPAFRLYFVEFDDNVGRDSVVRSSPGVKIRLLDDLYTSNAVISMNVTHHKNDASVAVIEVLNTSGTFDTDEFLTNAESKARKYGADDTNEDFLRKLKLKYGTGIQIRMGYSSNPEELDVVFTGQIVEIKTGPVVTFIAQSYKTELFQEVSVYEGNANPRNVMNSLLKKMPLPHFGRLYDTRDLSDGEFRKFVGNTLTDNGSGFFGLSGERGALSRIFGSKVTTAGRNIWFESNFDNNTTLGEGFRDIGESLPFGLSSADHFWLFDRVTVWDAFEEISRHNPGHICDVRPFNTEATLFFGLPDQTYMFRDQSFKERLIYERYLNAIQPVKLNNIAQSILTDFISSPFGTTTAQTQVQYQDFFIKFTETPLYARRGVAGESRALKNVEETIKRDGISGVWQSYSVFKMAQDNPAIRHDDGRTYNMLPLTATLNFQPDWKTIESYSPELLRFITAYFFKFRFDNWLGLEGLWPAKFLEWMAPLSDVTTSDIGSNFLEMASNRTQAGNNMYAALIGETNGLDGLPSSQISGLIVNPRANNQTNPNSGDLEDAAVFIGLSDAQYQAWATELATIRSSGGLLTYEQGRRIDELNALMQEYEEAVRKKTPGSRSVGRKLWDEWLWFRAFIHYFAQFLKSRNTPADREKAKVVQKELQKISQYRVPPGFKVFRNYHYASDRSDIISNDIECTTREMANTVVLKCPTEDISFDTIDNVEGGSSVDVLSSSQEWVYFPNDRGVSFHPAIDASSRILRSFQEPNANRKHAQANCLVSHMALAMRPMYRGQLKLVGRDIWPWDIVMVNDGFNMMYGPVEVERVVHEFSRDTGWVTTIEPHAYISVNSPSDKYQTQAAFDIMSAISTAFDIATIASIGLLVFTGVGAAVTGIRAVIAAGASTTVKTAAEAGAMRAAGAFVKSMASGVGRSTIASATGIGKLLPRLGKAGLLYGINQSLVTPVQNIMNNTVFKMNFDGDLWPVDVLPLNLHGVPLYAGVPLSDREIFTFWQMFEGSMKDLWSGMHSFFFGKESEGHFGVGPGENE